jgi:hypothetical protein
MDIIKFTTTMKPDGREYEKVVFWNRFWRNKTELILSLLPAFIAIVLFIMGYRNSFLLMIYVIFFCYPVFIFSQCKSNISYHLKHRDPIEAAQCTLTLMPSGVLYEFTDGQQPVSISWERLTTIYDQLGFYMFFNKGTMVFLIRKADIPRDMRKRLVDYLFENIDQNTCYIRIHR